MVKRLNPIHVGLVTLFTAMALSASVSADPASPEGRGGQMMHGAYGGSWGYAAHWKRTLTDEQRATIDRLRLDYLKKKYPLKARTKALKTELALLVTQDSPNKRDINKKIDELVDLKRQLLQLHYDYKVEVRKVLTAEQRVSFDIGLLKKSQHGKWRGRH